MVDNMSNLCQALSACAQFTSEQCNQMIAREWNIIAQPFFKTKVVSTTPNNVHLFFSDYSTVCTDLTVLLGRISKVACDLAISWKRQTEAAAAVVYKQLCGIHFEVTENQPLNAWIFQHDAETGFLIVPMLVAVQPAMVLVDVVVPIGASVTECCGEPLQLRFFPKVLVHNVLRQLLDVTPELLPHIIGMQHKVQHNSLVHQLLHLPTWENIIRISVVAAQQLADARVMTALCQPTGSPAEPVPISDLVESADSNFECTNKSHPELFRVIRHGQLPATQRKLANTSFTPAAIYRCTYEVVRPLLDASLYAKLALDVPDVPMSEVANAAMNDYFTQPMETTASSTEPEQQTGPNWPDLPSPSEQGQFAAPAEL